MSNDQLTNLPNGTDENEQNNTRRVTLTRSGVAALFAQSSYDTGDNKPLPANNLKRTGRENRQPPIVRSRLNPSNSENPTTSTSSFRSNGSSSVAQRASLFRYVVQRSSSFATGALNQVVSNTRRQTLKQIRSICNQHDKVSSIDIDVVPVASMTNCLEAPSIAAVQICRSISMPNAANKYRSHYEQQRLLIQSGGKPI